MEPSVQKLATKVMKRPLRLGGLSSVASVMRLERMAPIPSPARNRKRQRAATFGLRADANPANELIPNPRRSVGLLPVRSQNDPDTIPPTSIPAKMELATLQNVREVE